jgi:hypothetical protein
LRFLQTVTEIAAENNSTTLFPIPMDLFEPILSAFKPGREGGVVEPEEDEESLPEEGTVPELPPARGASTPAPAEPARVEKRRKP